MEKFKKDINLNLTNTEIENLSKNKFKKIVKSKTKEAALKYIIQLKGTKDTGKMSLIKYNHLNTMKYFSSPMFNQDESSLLMRLRTRCVNGIRNDFGGMFPEKECPVSAECKTVDNLQHLLECPALQDGLDTHIVASHKVTFEDIYSDHILKQKEVTTLFQLLLETRERILSTPAAGAGPLHCGNA